jgi:hypothetical protein
MASFGDEHDCGGYTRRYYDSQWDLIIGSRGDKYWRDKWNHVTYECDDSVSGTLIHNQIGAQVDDFDDEDEDEMWDD